MPGTIDKQNGSVNPMDIVLEDSAQPGKGDSPLLSEYYANSEDESLRTPKAATPFMEVVAPATLAEGYTFDVTFGNQTIAVTVPTGGVQEGQRFRAPIPVIDSSSGAKSGFAARASGPVGKWKDGLCDCCILGCCHSVLWLAWCCPAILVAQIMTRLKLNFVGFPKEYTFKVGLGIAAVMTTLTISMYTMIIQAEATFFQQAQKGNPEPIVFGYGYYLMHSILFGLSLYLLISICNTRASIRNKYGIPETTCSGCEDCCCVYCCSCCTVSQMARHTADYGTYRSECCSETGLPAGSPSIV